MRQNQLLLVFPFAESFLNLSEPKENINPPYFYPQNVQIIKGYWRF